MVPVIILYPSTHSFMDWTLTECIVCQASCLALGGAAGIVQWNRVAEVRGEGRVIL